MGSQDYRDDGEYEDIGTGQDYLPFICGYCNREVDTHFHSESGHLSKVTCLNCNFGKVVEEFIECGHCENSRRERFRLGVDNCGRITFSHCLECGRHLHLSGQPAPAKENMDNNILIDKMSSAGEKSGRIERELTKMESRVDLVWTKIADLRDVRRGDHIVWHRPYGCDHHAIIVDILNDSRALRVIHYTNGVVQEETREVNPSEEDLYRIDYPSEDSYPVVEVLQRTFAWLGEAKYDLFTNNCEHFARWCKTGRTECRQVPKYAEQKAVNKARQEAAADAIESTGAGPINRVRAAGINEDAGQVFCETPDVSLGAILGGLACTVVIGLAAFYRDEIRRQLSKLGSERAGGLTGGSGMDIVGKLLVPVPILGDLIGSTLGNLIEGYVAVLTGKKLDIAAIKHHSCLSTDDRQNERRTQSPSEEGREVCSKLRTTLTVINRKMKKTEHTDLQLAGPIIYVGHTHCTHGSVPA